MSILLNLNSITKGACKIQSNDFDGSFIKGSVHIIDAHSGENFCGTAGLTTGGSHYVNSSDSASSSNSSSSSASSAGQAAAAKAHHPKTKVAHNVVHKVKSACAWGDACNKVIIMMI